MVLGRSTPLTLLSLLPTKDLLSISLLARIYSLGELQNSLSSFASGEGEVFPTNDDEIRVYKPISLSARTIAFNPPVELHFMVDFG